MGVTYDEKRKTWTAVTRIKETGKWRKKRGFSTKKDAQQWLDELNSEPEGANVDKCDETKSLTFAEIAAQWEDSMQSSQEMRLKHAEHWTKRCQDIYNMPMTEITRQVFENWRIQLMNSEYATRTKNTTIQYVKSVARYADIVYGYPDQAKILRRIKFTQDEEMTEMHVWTPEEFRKFAAWLPSRYVLFFRLLYFCGLRRGEAIALQAKDVLADGHIIIRYNQRSAKEGLKPTKTRQVRKILLPPALFDQIYKQAQESAPYVFGGTEPFAPSTISRVFNQAIERSRVKPIRLHDLRHSFASNMIAAKCDIVAVSKYMGHSSIEITLKVYAHLLTKSELELTTKSEEIISRVDQNVTIQGR